MTTTQLLVGALVTLMGGSAATALVVWVLNQREYKNKVIPAEGLGMEQLLGKIKTLVTDKLADVNKIQTLSTDAAALKVLVEIRDKELIRQGVMLRDILVEQGRAEERERSCQARLSEVLDKLESFGELHTVNRRLVQDNLRMQGELDDIQRNGTEFQGGESSEDNVRR